MAYNITSDKKSLHPRELIWTIEEVCGRRQCRRVDKDGWESTNNGFIIKRGRWCL